MKAIHAGLYGLGFWWGSQANTGDLNTPLFGREFTDPSVFYHGKWPLPKLVQPLTLWNIFGFQTDT